MHDDGRSTMLSTTPLSRSTTRDATLSEDTVYTLLANRRRRFAIHALKRADAVISVTELSTRITAWERGVDPDDVEYEDRRTIHTTLTSSHLPMLDENGVIEYDTEASLVEPTATLEDLDVYVEVLRGRKASWSQYYLGLSAFAVVMMLAIAIDTPLLAGLEPIDASVFTATAFAVSSVIHYHYGERAALGNEEKPPELRQRE